MDRAIELINNICLLFLLCQILSFFKLSNISVAGCEQNTQARHNQNILSNGAKLPRKGMDMNPGPKFLEIQWHNIEGPIPPIKIDETPSIMKLQSSNGLEHRVQICTG